VPTVVRRRLRAPHALAAAVVFLPILAPAGASADQRNNQQQYKPALTSSAAGGASMDRFHHLGARPLSRNVQGHDVRVAQDYLRRAGFQLKIDGTYGPDTIRAVKQFERANGLHVDGNLSLVDISFLRGFVERGGVIARVRGVKATAATQETAGLNADGTATAPAGAPPQVAQIIAAANRIARLPYRYGGGHGKWEDTAYDCSGSVSYALHAAGLLDAPLTSGELANWGEAGPGRWVTIYANPTHVIMEIGGQFYGTSGFGHPETGGGPGWFSVTPSADYLAGFTARHPAGL